MVPAEFLLRLFFIDENTMPFTEVMQHKACVYYSWNLFKFETHFFCQYLPSSYDSTGLRALLTKALKTTSSFDLHVLYSLMQYGSNGYAGSSIRQLGILTSLLLQFEILQVSQSYVNVFKQKSLQILLRCEHYQATYIQHP